MLIFYNNFFLSNLRAISSIRDCLRQIAFKTLLKAISHYYIQRKTCNRLFCLQLTDFYASNIFVDKDENITCLIDYKWVYALLAEMLFILYQLIRCAINRITHKKLYKFKIVYREFINIFKEEEVKMTLTNPLAITLIMHNNQKFKVIQFQHYITFVNATWSLVEDYISPRFLCLFTDSEGILL